MGRVRRKRKASKRPEEPTRCHYCERTYEPHRIEMDHFPVPHRHGGTAVVPACLSCHDQKDRTLALDWSVEEREDACGQLAHLLDAAGVTAGLEQQYGNDNFRRALTFLLDRLEYDFARDAWPLLRLPARLFLAKMLAAKGQDVPSSLNARMRKKMKKQMNGNEEGLQNA